MHITAVTLTSPSTDGADFVGGPVCVTFNSSVTSAGSVNVTFQTLTDSVFEGEEYFLVNITTVDSNVDVDTGADWGTVVIQDQTSKRAMWSWGGGCRG